MFVWLWYIICFWSYVSCDFTFRIVTDKYIDKTRGDIVAGFGDFNADKLVDIFVIRRLHEISQVDVLLAVQDKSYYRHTLLNKTLDTDEVISGILLADYDSDVQLDVLVITAKIADMKDSLSYDRKFEVYWGNTHNVSLEEEAHAFGEIFKDDPMLFSSYGDYTPVLMTLQDTNKNVLWSGTANRTFLSVTDKFQTLTPKVPQSTGFIDLNADFNPELLITTTKGYSVYKGGNFNQPDGNYTYPSKDGPVFQSAFGDFNQDGIIEHIVAYCTTKDCKANASKIAIYTNNTWINVWESSATTWLFDPEPYRANSHIFFNSLRVGDYNSDGYPDLMTILIPAEGPSERRVVLLENVPSNKTFGREFQVRDLLPKIGTNAYLATFYDINEDGTLDILWTGAANGSTVPTTELIANGVSKDACFLKVTVVSGICYDNCPDNNNPYSVNMPGPVVKYELTTTAGTSQYTTAGQLTQSGNFALQLPYVFFGLGETPNFIDQITNSIPYRSKNRTKVWPQQIIPNSQLIVVPYPITELSQWKMQLFVTPSRQIYLTGICLLATCGLLAIIVAVLQWREMREDAKEKKQESQKFHFDAM